MAGDIWYDSLSTHRIKVWRMRLITSIIHYNYLYYMHVCMYANSYVYIKLHSLTSSSICSSTIQCGDCVCDSCSIQFSSRIGDAHWKQVPLCSSVGCCRKTEGHNCYKRKVAKRRMHVPDSSNSCILRCMQNQEEIVHTHSHHLQYQQLQLE